jgi:hypothetical protein
MKKPKSFTFMVDLNTLTPAAQKALLAADAQLIQGKSDELGALFAQVWVSKGLRNIEINGSFIAPKYADRIQAILNERKAKWEKVKCK